jgi:hypothetical protein
MKEITYRPASITKKKLLFVSIATILTVLLCGLLTSRSSMGDQYSERAFELAMLAAALLSPLFIVWSLEKSRSRSWLFALFVEICTGSIVGALLGFVIAFVIGVHSELPFIFNFYRAVGWFLIWVATGVLYGAIAGAILLPVGKAVVYGEEVTSK